MGQDLPAAGAATEATFGLEAHKVPDLRPAAVSTRSGLPNFGLRAACKVHERRARGSIPRQGFRSATRWVFSSARTGEN